MAKSRSLTMFIDHSSMKITPVSLDEFNMMLRSFEHGDKVTVTVENYIRKKTLPQMGLLHKYLAYISDYTGDDIASIKIEMKKRFGARNEDGSLKSTSKYLTDEMNYLIEGTRNFGIQELNINMPLPEELKTKNIK